MDFEWDSERARRNLHKHRISFEEACSVFGDPYAITFRDPDHSAGELRWLTFGVSKGGLLLLVSHSHRGKRVRLVSARRATRAERKIYEEG